MLKNDWMLSQINQLLRMIANIVFKKNTVEYIVTEKSKSDEVELYNRLEELLNLGKINDAENLLFEKLDYDNLEFLKIGVDFYGKIHNLSEEELKKYNFTRKEIKEGLEDLLDEFGIDIIV